MGSFRNKTLLLHSHENSLSELYCISSLKYDTNISDYIKSALYNFFNYFRIIFFCNGLKVQLQHKIGTCMSNLMEIIIKKIPYTELQ